MSREITREAMIKHMNALRLKANSIRFVNPVAASHVYAHIAEKAEDMSMHRTTIDFLNAAATCAAKGGKPEEAAAFRSRASKISDLLRKPKQDGDVQRTDAAPERIYVYAMLRRQSVAKAYSEQTHPAHKLDLHL